MYTTRRDIANDITAAFDAQGLTLTPAARQVIQAFTEALTGAGEQYSTLYDPSPSPSYNWVGGVAGQAACPAGYAPLYGTSAGVFSGCLYLPADNAAGLQGLVAYMSTPAVRAAVLAGDTAALAQIFVQGGGVPSTAALLRALGSSSGPAALYAQAISLAAQAIAQDLGEPLYARPLAPALPPALPPPAVPALPALPGFPGFPAVQNPFGQGLPALPNFGSGPPVFPGLPLPSGFADSQNPRLTPPVKGQPAGTRTVYGPSAEPAASGPKVWPWVVLSAAAAAGVWYVSKHSRPAEGLYHPGHARAHGARAA